MTRFSLTLRTALAACLVAVVTAGCIIIPIPNNTVNLTATLFGYEQVPPVATNAGGSLTAKFDKTTNQFSWTLNYVGLSGPVTAAHFHGPAAPGQNAGVALGLANPVTNPSSGEATLTADQAANLLEGRWYLNLHTAANPGGEIRGQVVRR